MSTNNRPWYPWYPKDFNGDEKVRCLPPYAELIYRRALDVMWQANDIRIPNAMRLLYESLGKGIAEDDFKEAWGRIQYPDFELFRVTDDKKWVFSKRLRAEMDKIIETVNARSIAGAKGAAVRWEKEKRDTRQTHSKRIANPKQTDSYTDAHTDTDLKDKDGKKPAQKNRAVHFDKKINSDYLENIISACEKFKKLPVKPKSKWNPYRFVQIETNDNQHPGAILEALNGLIALWPDIKNPWSYGKTIIKTKSGNYHERDHQRDAEKFKTAWVTDDRIKKLTAGIGANAKKGG